MKPQVSPLLEVDNLCLGIKDGGQRLVERVSFSLDPGCILGIAGESGSGKTLTASALAGMLPGPVSILGGRILFQGKPLYNVSSGRYQAVRGRDILFLFQSPLSALDPCVRTGIQVLDTLRQGLGCSRDLARKETDKALERVGLNLSCYDAFPFELSGGQRQRVLMAMAAGLGPRLLIADEPTAGQDDDNKDRLIALLRSLVAELNAAALLISHDLRVLESLAHTLVILFQGRQVEWGRTSLILSHPDHHHTRSLTAAAAYLRGRGSCS